MEIVFPIIPAKNDAAFFAVKFTNNVFTIVFPHLNHKQYKVSLINFYMISSKINNIIDSDPTQTQYIISNPIFTEQFLDSFFNSIQQSFTIKIEENYLKEFIHLSIDLSFSNSITRSSILSYLCQKIEPSNNIINDDNQKFEFLLRNIEKINYSILHNMPENIIDELIQNAKFDNDDKFAKYLLADDFLFKKYFRFIKVSKISGEVTSEVLQKLKQFYDIQNISNEEKNFFEEIFTKLQQQSDYRKIIKVLYVNSKVKQSIDLRFLDDLNDDQLSTKYFIHYLSMNDIEFQARLQKDKDYMSKFDIFVLGGCDSFAFNVKGINQETFINIKKYHNQNGIILILHDVMYGPLKDILKPLTELIGYIQINPLIQEDLFSQLNMFDEVKINDSFSDNDIQSIVFPIGNSFNIKELHYTPKYDQHYVIFTDSKSKDNYYTENLEEHLADCQMGHNIEISNQEQKFFYNLICHLFEHCKNHKVKTIIE